MNPEEFLSKKKQIEQLQRKLDKLSGAKEQVLNQLKREFGFISLEEAARWVKKSEKEVEKLGKEYETLKKEWEEKWQGKI